MNILHRLMHRLGLNGGYVDHEKDEQGIWWIGQRCGTCGEFERKDLSRHQDVKPVAACGNCMGTGQVAVYDAHKAAIAVEKCPDCWGSGKTNL